MHPFTSAEAANPEFSYLIRKSGNAYTFAADGYDPYFFCQYQYHQRDWRLCISFLSMRLISPTHGTLCKISCNGCKRSLHPVSIMDLLAVSNSNYMKQFIYILLLTVTGIFAGCTDIDKENPYDNQLHSLQVTAVYPDGYTDHLREGVTVKIEDVDRGNSYKAKTDKNGWRNSL